MHVNIVLPLTCVNSFFEGRGFGVHQLGRSKSFRENDHNSLTAWFILIKFRILIQFNIGMQNSDETSPSICPTSGGHLVKMLISLESHGIF